MQEGRHRHDPGSRAASFQQSYPPHSWIYGIAMAAQPVDGSMTASFDDILTETRTDGTTSRRPTRRHKAPPMDPRRAPGAIAGSPQTAEGTAAPAGAEAEAAVAAPRGIGGGITGVQGGLWAVPAQPDIYRMLDRRGGRRV